MGEVTRFEIVHTPHILCTAPTSLCLFLSMCFCLFFLLFFFYFSRWGIFMHALKRNFAQWFIFDCNYFRYGRNKKKKIKQNKRNVVIRNAVAIFHCLCKTNWEFERCTPKINLTIQREYSSGRGRKRAHIRDYRNFISFHFISNNFLSLLLSE